jgi:protein O-mannosyl-transferase
MENGRDLATGKRDWIYLILICVSGLAAYFALPGFLFVFDDRTQILGNPSLLHASSIPRYFQHHTWSYVSGAPPSYYRPLFSTWLNLNYALFGPHPAGWHVLLLGLHLLASLLVFWTVRDMFRNSTTGIVAALLFAVHPVHVESVAWVSGGTDPLAAVFILLSFLMYRKAQDTHAWRRAGVGLLSLSSFACALLTKEVVLLFPLLLLTDSLLLSGERRGLNWKLASVVPYLLLAAGYCAIRVSVLGAFSEPHTQLRWATIFLTLPSVLLFYLALLFFPIGLSPFYETPYRERADLVHFWIPALVVTAAMVLSYLSIRRLTNGDQNRNDGSRQCAVFAVWTIVFLVPALDLAALDPGEIAHDRYLYLPSVGFLAIVAFTLQQLAERIALPQRLQSLGFAALILLLGSATATQSYYWKNDLALYRRAVAVAPDNINALNNLADTYLEAGDYGRGIALHKQILERNPNYAESYYNIGLAYYNQRDYPLAENYLKEAVRLRPAADWCFYLGMAQFKSGEMAGAEQSLRQSVSQEPVRGQFHAALGIVLETEGKTEPALEELEQARGLDPGNAAIQNEIVKLQKQLSR